MYFGQFLNEETSGHPTSTIEFERRHNRALGFGSEQAFVEALTKDIPPAPEHQSEILAANRSGRPRAAIS